MISILYVSQASVLDNGNPKIKIKSVIYKFGNTFTMVFSQFSCVKNVDKNYQLAFGIHVKSLREYRNWSQKQLGAFANIDVNQISRIENGQNAANLHTIRMLAIALGKNPSDLLKFEYDIKLNTDFSERHTKENKNETSKVLRKLLETNFLSSSKSTQEIINQCKKLYSTSLPSSAVSGVLKRLMQEKYVKRIKSPEKKGNFLYKKILKK